MSNENKDNHEGREEQPDRRDEMIEDYPEMVLGISATTIPAAEVLQAVDIAAGFIGAFIFVQAAEGIHQLSIVSPSGNMDLIFGKKDNTVRVSANHDNFVIFLASAIASRLPAVLTMHSYVGEDADSDDETLVMLDSSPQEARVWLIRDGRLRAFTSEEAIDYYCTDAETGKFMQPKLNVAYCDGWVPQG